MIVDVHAHYHPSGFNQALGRLTQGRVAGGFPGQPDTDEEGHLQQRLDMMEQAGVGMQVLSPAAGRAPYGADEGAALAAARAGNDAAAALVRRYPAKFRSFVSLPLPHIEASLREMARGLDDLAMVGVNLHCSALDRSVAEAEFEPIYEELNRRSGVVFFHPCGNGIRSPLITDYGLGAAVGTSLEDAAIVLHLIARKLPAKYPNITFIVPHLGGPIPMLLERLDRQFSMRQRELPEPPSVTARRFYYDTVGHGSAAGLLCACTAFGASHMLPGSDFPVLLSYETYTRTFAYIREVALPDGAASQILERTAPSILKLA
ncbi:MAG: amidohydrolase family protein [Chloroflexota bacterium]